MQTRGYGDADADGILTKNNISPPPMVGGHKYIENFTSKTEIFQIKKTLIFFIFLLKTYIVGTH